MTDLVQGLRGWRIVILRPHDDLPLEEFIQSQGGIVERLPMFSIVPLTVSADEIAKWQCALQQSSYLFIASQYAVHSAPAALLQAITDVSDLKIITMGNATSIAAANAGLSVFFTPPPGTTSETLSTELFFQQSALQGKTVSLLAGEDGRTFLADLLAARGAKIEWIKIYRQEKKLHALAPLFEIWKQTNKNCFIATSLKALEILLELTPENKKSWILQQFFIVVSDRIAQQAKKWGIQHIYIAKGADKESIAQALQEMCQIGDTTK